MDIVRNSRRQAGRFVSLTGVLLATLLPAIAPVMVSADTLTARSVTLSSSVTKATSDLEVKFNTSANVQSFDVTFCDAAGGTCNAPTGLVATNVTATSGGTIGTNTANKIQVTTGSAVSTVDFKGAGLTNPDNAGTIYARINAYSDTAYTTSVDTGAVALAFTDGVNVGGDVLETLTFCVQGGDTTLTDCSGSTAPDVVLGTDGVLSTTGGASSGDQGVQTFLATNARNGAVINLKSGTANCSGLTLQGHEGDTEDHGCLITALGSPTALAGITNTTAQFGMSVATVANLTPVTNWATTTNYFMDSAVTSAYGAQVLSTDDPVAAGTAGMTFAASATPTTPAGHYYANLSMIATGKY